MFSRLFALNNMPIKRYVDYLQQRGQLQEYMETLVNAFNPTAAEVSSCLEVLDLTSHHGATTCNADRPGQQGQLLECVHTPFECLQDHSVGYRP